MMRYEWRQMARGDLPRLMEIAAQVHVGYFEAETVFAERLALFPEGCRIAVRIGEDEEEVIGYAVMHPASYGTPPPLNQLLRGFDAQSDCLHLHDIALLPQARGSGLGRALVVELRQVMDQAGLVRAALVAVHDSAAYWRAAGFTLANDDLSQGPDSLFSYGPGALYMTLELAQQA